jgi:chemotaxis protein methyltransferase CheR
MNVPPLTDNEFGLFRKMIYETAGINLSDAKKALVSGRLAKRIKHYNLPSYADYFKLVKSNAHGELQTAVDLLTTNETFFFREPKHFDFLRDKMLPAWRGGQLRVWSAASSSGEEAYTLAMMLAEHATTDAWEIVGTDISTRVLERARNGQYALADTEDIPRSYLTKYCLKGIGGQDGTFIITRDLRRRVSFIHANLQQDLSKLGYFDVIFLRNVLIYFDLETKQRVVSRVMSRLKSGGYLMVGHSESLNGITDDLKLVLPSIYRRP